MKYPTTDLADLARAAVASYTATSPGSQRHYVVLVGLARASVFPSETIRRDEMDRLLSRRFVVRRIYAGGHKQVARACTVVVGHDLADASHPLLCVAVRSWMESQIEVTGTPPQGLDAPFEGVFALERLDVPEPK